MAPILGSGGVREASVGLMTWAADQSADWYREEVLQGRPDRGGYERDDLPHWMLWALGCRDGKILNRDVPDRGIRWTGGKSVDKLFNGSQRMAAWRAFHLEKSPRPGDILILEGNSVIARTAIVVSASPDGWSAVSEWDDPRLRHS